MPGSKKLEGVEPFNKFWFKTCFYHALFPIVTYYGKDYNPIILNELCSFEKRDDRRLVPVDIGTFKYEDLLKGQGLQEEKLLIKTGIKEFIIDSIDKDMPIIAAVNSYYLQFRDDTYMKTRLVHYICIYGYSEEKGSLDIIDHRYMNSFMYEKKTVSFAGLLRALNGFFEPGLTSSFGNFISESRYKYNFFRDKPVKKYKSFDIECLKKRYAENAQVALEYLTAVSEDFQKDLRSDFGSVDWAYYKDFFVKLSWQRENQKYIFLHYGNNELFEEATAFLNSARYIYGTLAKGLLVKKFSPESLSKLSARIDMLIANQRRIGELQNDLLR